MAINIYPANGFIHLDDVTNDSIIGVETPYGKFHISRILFEEGAEYGLVNGLNIRKVAAYQSKSDCLERLSILPLWAFERDVNVYFFDSERDLAKWLFDIKEAPIEEEPIAHFESGETECLQAIPILDSQACSLVDTCVNRTSKFPNKMTILSRLYDAEKTPGTVAYVMKKALTREQYKRFLKEIQREQLMSAYISFMEEERGITAGALLKMSFIWRYSNHGYYYWANIHKRLL